MKYYAFTSSRRSINQYKQTDFTVYFCSQRPVLPNDNLLHSPQISLDSIPMTSSSTAASANKSILFLQGKSGAATDLWAVA